MAFLCDRQKLILLADKSPLGWRTLLEYKHRDLADDDEDEKKIYRAESRAARVVSVPRGGFLRPLWPDPLSLRPHNFLIFFLE